MRWATWVICMLVCAACNDLRDYRGTWDGTRVGDADVLRVGAGDAATLAIDAIDSHGMAGTLAIEGLLEETAFESLAGAEADVLSNMSFAGNPLRVYLAFVAMKDGGGDALAMIALYDEHRVEVRVLRGGTTPIYAIYAMTGGS